MFVCFLGFFLQIEVSRLEPEIAMATDCKVVTYNKGLWWMPGGVGEEHGGSDEEKASVAEPVDSSRTNSGFLNLFLFLLHSSQEASDYCFFWLAWKMK